MYTPKLFGVTASSRGAMRPKELHALVAALGGFLAFSLPLLVHDTKHLWMPPSLPTPSPDPVTSPYAADGHDPDSPKSRFWRALSVGDKAEAEAVVAEDSATDLINSKHWHGATPLFEAARSGSLELVQWLVDSGAAVDEPNDWGDTAVNEAATMGHFEIVWLLAERGASLTRHLDQHHGGSILLSALRHKSLDTLKRLHANGVPLNTVHFGANTALHEAARQGEQSICEWLVEHGADLDAANDAGDTPMCEAATMANWGPFWYLLGKGASIGEAGSRQQAQLVMATVRHGNLDALRRLQQMGANIERIPTTFSTPLVEAVRLGDAAIAEWLLHQGANVSGESSQGETPLALAAYHGHFELMWRFHEAGAQLNTTDSHGSTPLMSAVFHGKLDVAKRLLDAGMMVNVGNERGDTPLTVAASKGNVPLARLLVQRGATLEPRGRRRDTPLHRAARFRRLEMAQYLLEELQGQVDATNRREDTPLFEAIRAENVQMVEELLRHGAALEHRNHRGMTPWLEAADRGSLPLLELLRQRGANTNARNHDDDGPFELARYKHNSEGIERWLSGEVGLKKPDWDHEEDHGEHHDEHDSAHYG